MVATKTEAARELQQRGLSTLDIATELGISPNNVRSLFYAARCGPRNERSAESLGCAVRFPADVLEALGPFAARRGIHPNTLARQIVMTVIDENLVDAVLDDGAPQ
jgi:hypothetical protein